MPFRCPRSFPLDSPLFGVISIDHQPSSSNSGFHVFFHYPYVVVSVNTERPIYTPYCNPEEGEPQKCTPSCGKSPHTMVDGASDARPRELWPLIGTVLLAIGTGCQGTHLTPSQLCLNWSRTFREGGVRG